MRHLLDLFSPETLEAFTASDQSVSGFRIRHRKAASRVKPGDLLVCYLTRVSRWVGLLLVQDGPFDDPTPIFVDHDDPFTVRFHVEPVVLLPPELGIPIHDPQVWSALSFTRGYDPLTPGWTGALRTSLVELKGGDGKLLERLLREQAAKRKPYPLTDKDRRRLERHVIQGPEGPVKVSVPDDEDEGDDATPTRSRESIKMQALLADMGARMHCKIWIPSNDRERVLKELKGDRSAVLQSLPVKFERTALNIIEYIDVIWIKERSIIRAFEVEHTTAIYSGILRMADLLASVPNLNIRLHIVAPEERRRKVLEQIGRPAFSLIEGGGLAKRCTLLTYEDVRMIAALPHLERTEHAILDDYAVAASEDV